MMRNKNEPEKNIFFTKEQTVFICSKKGCTSKVMDTARKGYYNLLKLGVDICWDEVVQYAMKTRSNDGFQYFLENYSLLVELLSKQDINVLLSGGETKSKFKAIIKEHRLGLASAPPAESDGLRDFLHDSLSVLHEPASIHHSLMPQASPIASISVDEVDFPPAFKLPELDPSIVDHVLRKNHAPLASGPDVAFDFAPAFALPGLDQSIFDDISPKYQTLPLASVPLEPIDFSKGFGLQAPKQPAIDNFFNDLFSESALASLAQSDASKASTAQGSFFGEGYVAGGAGKKKRVRDMYPDYMGLDHLEDEESDHRKPRF